MTEPTVVSFVAVSSGIDSPVSSSTAMMSSTESSPEVIHEASFTRDLLGIHTKLFDDNVLNALFDVFSHFHSFLFVLWKIALNQTKDTASKPMSLTTISTFA